MVRRVRVVMMVHRVDVVRHVGVIVMVRSLGVVVMVHHTSFGAMLVMCCFCLLWRECNSKVTSSPSYKVQVNIG